jgi:hypothetical protein
VGQYSALDVAVLNWDEQTADKALRLLLAHGARVDTRDKVHALLYSLLIDKFVFTV